MTRRLATLTTLLVLAFAAPAAAQGGAFGPLPAPQPTATPTPATATSDTGETGSTTLYIILGALVVGFGVMGYFITRDARQKAPTIVAAGPAVPEGTGARKPHTAAAKKKMRQKTRAQKQARKAHRR
jgi:RsiW-degrading membrane proteinase PrsW (M82 family)